MGSPLVDAETILSDGVAQLRLRYIDALYHACGPWPVAYNFPFVILLNFSPNSAHSHWLLRGHMTSNNKTVSRQKSLSGQQCKICDVRG